MKLECVHADTCLADYWGGHHLPHVQIPVWYGMTMREIKARLHDELRMGAVGGSDPIVQDDSGEAGDRWYKKAHAAVNRLAPAKKGQRRFFTDIPACADDDAESIYAFFVFVEADQ